MKKAFSLLLTVAMLLTALSVLAVSPVSAEETAAPERTPLKVTFQSSSENISVSDGSTIDWSKIFNTSNTNRIYGRTKTDISIIGKFEQPTQITSAVFRSHFYRHRMNGVVLQFSTDGINWTMGYTLQEVRDAKDGAVNIEIATPDTTLYSYVRIFKSVVMDDAKNLYGEENGDYIELDVQHVAFYNEGEAGKDIIEASLLKVTAPQGGFSNAESFFDYSNSTVISQNTGNVFPCDMVVGKFDRPTVLTDIYVKYKDASMNNTIIKASVDGENWTTVVTMQGIWNNANNKATARAAHFHVNDDTAYNYIQIVRNHKFWGGGFQAYSIGFLGEEQNVSNTVKYQTKVDGDAWALRLISTIDTLDCDAVGFEITATAAELAEAKSWDRSTDIVYTSITETVNGQEEIRDAAYCGGNYIYTAAITGISIAEYSAITFTVKPYVVIDGAKVYGATQTIVLNDGVAA